MNKITLYPSMNFNGNNIIPKKVIKTLPIVQKETTSVNKQIQSKINWLKSITRDRGISDFEKFSVLNSYYERIEHLIS